MRFVKNYPALFIEEIGVLVIADLHIGISYDLYQSGINIPSQVKKITKTIENLIKKTRAKKLIILGDLKHKVPGMSWQELKDIPAFLDYFSSKVKVIISKGNHDDQIERIVPEKVRVHGTRGFKIKNFGFFHGHTWPSEKLISCDYLIMAHSHPMIQFKDKFDYKIIESVWVKSKIDQEKIKERYKVKKTGRLEVVIVPPFNKLLGGTPVNVKRENEEYLGPLLKNDFIEMDSAEIYLLDGTFLGELKNISNNKT